MKTRRQTQKRDATPVEEIEEPPVKQARSEDPKPDIMATNKKHLTLTELWDILEVGLAAIYTRETPLSVPAYMLYYSQVHDFCANNNVPQQKNKSRGRATATSKGGAEFNGGDLYHKLKEHLTDYVTAIQTNVASLNDEDELLSAYAEEWKKFAFSSKVTEGLFRYLNRHWIKREKDEGNESVRDVYSLCLHLWKEIIFSKNSEGVTKAALQLITRDRNGDKIQDELIKTVVDSLEQLGLEYGDQQSNGQHSNVEYGRPCAKENPGFTDAQKSRLRVYLENFEEELLNITDVYYSEEAEEFLQKHSIVQYMIKVEERLREEEERVRRYLNMFSLNRIAYSLETVLISNKLSILQGEFETLLSQDRDEDLARMYQLCSRVVGGLDNLKTKFQEFVTAKGQKAIEDMENGADADPKTYIDAILTVHKRYKGLVVNSFGGEAGFVQAFDKACESFVNHNTVTRRNQQYNKSSEMLAKYVDFVLKKGSRKGESEDIEDHLNDTITVFFYLEDKDIFQKFYNRFLSKRLLNDMSLSDDAESGMIARLKEACGHDYTTASTRMFGDINTSKDMSRNFRDWASSTKPGKDNVDTNMQILSTGVWPFSTTYTFDLPPQLSSTVALFEEYYKQLHSGRKLKWIHHLARGEISASGFGKRKYSFTVSTPQIVVLLKYNSTDALTLSHLQGETQLPLDTLRSVVASFVKVDLLKLPEGVTFSPSLDEDTQLSLNLKFASKRMKMDLVKLLTATKGDSESKKEQQQIAKTLDDDRKMIIQAAIVRVMKMRKKIQHSILIGEVVEQVKARFQPKIPMVKKCIDMLMEKEYMKRAENEKDFYEYIS